jgi:hypothetical protein
MCVLAAVIIYSFKVKDIMGVADVVLFAALVVLYLGYRVLPAPRLTICEHDPDEEVQTLGLNK